MLARTNSFIDMFRPDLSWWNLDLDHHGLNGGQVANSLFNIDVEDTPSAYLVKADVPGVTKDDIDLTIENGMLVISYERKNESEQNLYVRERKYGKFERTVLLPDNDINQEACTASLKNGVLTVTVEKPAKAKRKKLPIEEEQT